MHSPPSELARFAEKYRLAREADLSDRPRRGTSGLELEWDLLDSSFRPLQTVGAGPEERGFIDAFRDDHLPPWLRERSQLEVFRWMIEFATQPYYSPRGPVYEARILEAALFNALARAGRDYGERLYGSTGNLLFPPSVGARSIPQGWNLAKRRYLERCVELYGAALATTGIHANLSLPESLLAWDFMHLTPTERGNGHLDSYKNRVYVEGTRRMRAFASLFIAASANTPMKPDPDGEGRVVLTEHDSVRNLTFPCPEAIDPPDLYRSHGDYIRISYALVRAGIRFGNNNWNPVRARSFAEPVERLIDVSSSQLHEIYRQGLYASGEAPGVESLAQRIVMENLLARIDLPMARVEVRTDEGGHPLDLEIANLALKELLLMRIYADPAYAASFRYSAEDIARARRNEGNAARAGMRAELEDPASGKPLAMRAFLARTLADLQPLAEVLGWTETLQPLAEIAQGAPNTAERLRARVRREIGDSNDVPVELLAKMAKEREAQVADDVENIRASLRELGGDAPKLQALVAAAREDARRDPAAPVSFLLRSRAASGPAIADKTSEIVELAQQLIRIPSVSGAEPDRRRLEDIRRAATFIYDDLAQAGVVLRWFEDGDYPALLATLPGAPRPPVLLSAHLDVVEPDPDETQFEPRLDGDFLAGRGAADMKTVLATYLTWLKDRCRRSPSPAGIGLLVVSNEEIGEGEPTGTPHALAALRRETGYEPHLLVAGERTGEHGNELWGEICVENRGLVRMEVSLRGIRGHTGTRAPAGDLSGRLFKARDALEAIFASTLRLNSPDDWRTQVRFPFVHVGELGIFNVAAAQGTLGIEIRPIPGEDIGALLQRTRVYCFDAGLDLRIIASEPGVTCQPENPYLGRLIEAVRETSGREPVLGKKLPATSARFAPRGAGVVWGQTGIGPHAPDERHFIPSILPYYRALDVLADKCPAASAESP